MATRSNIDQSASGLTPKQWEERLTKASSNPDALKKAIEALDREMRQEKTWLHENPSPGKLLGLVFRFIGRNDDDLEHLSQRIDEELEWEKNIKRRYRGWLPGEQALNRLLPYLKEFSGQVAPCESGLQFSGFVKYKGIFKGTEKEVFTFYLNKRFPGRDPANFHLLFEPNDKTLVIKRVYRMELPRTQDGPSTARAILAEMTRDICPCIDEIKSLVVDNAANLDTRKALIIPKHTEGGVIYELNKGMTIAKTPLGHLMEKLSQELGMARGEFSAHINSYGIIKIELSRRPQLRQVPLNTNDAQ